MTALLITAADTTSKTPFFILGGALAVWAVLLSAIGMRSPGFPFNARGQSGVIALTLVIAALAVGAAILTS